MSKLCPVCKKNTIKDDNAPKCLSCVREEYKKIQHRISVSKATYRDRIVLTRAE
jgi:hypothetical protein